jgi:hypothetical protein
MLIYFYVLSSKELSDLLTIVQNIDLKSRPQAASFISIDQDLHITDESNDLLPHSGVLTFLL